MSIKAIFFDIDGTLLSHKSKRVPEDTRKAFEQLKAKGIKLFASTGRHILEIDRLPVRDMEFDGYVLLNGQLCLDGQRRLLWGNAIPKQDLEGILSFFEEKKIPLGLLELERFYINFVNAQVKEVQSSISSEVPEVGSYEGGEVYLVDAFINHREAKMLLERMPHCKVIWWNDLGADIISAGGGKVAGIQHMMSHYHIHREEIMAFGDEENDVEMIKFAQIGVAMGNAVEHLKQHADYITDDVDAGGILHALQHFGILE